MSVQSPVTSERIERARELVAPYRERPGVVGAYVGGSSNQPYVDPTSDLDLFVVFEDAAFDAIPERERYVLTMTKAPPRRKDVELIVLPWSALVGYSTARRDGLRAGYADAHVLFTIDDRLPSILAKIPTLADVDFQPRIRVHYYELMWAMEKAGKARRRGQLPNARLLEAMALDAARRVLFVAQRRIPARRDCSQELRLAQVPLHLVEAWETAMTSDAPQLEALRKTIDAWLTSAGHTFHLNTFVLTTWALFTTEGAAATDRWSATL